MRYFPFLFLYLLSTPFSITQSQSSDPKAAHKKNRLKGSYHPSLSLCHCLFSLTISRPRYSKSWQPHLFTKGPPRLLHKHWQQKNSKKKDRRKVHYKNGQRKATANRANREERSTKTKREKNKATGE